MPDAIVGGRLHGAPQTHRNSNGERIVTAFVRVTLADLEGIFIRHGTPDGADFFVSVSATDDRAAAELLALSEGDRVLLNGIAKVGSYESRDDGQKRPSIDLTVHDVLPGPARQPKSNN